MYLIPYLPKAIIKIFNKVICKFFEYQNKCFYIIFPQMSDIAFTSSFLFIVSFCPIFFIATASLNFLFLKSFSLCKIITFSQSTLCLLSLICFDNPDIFSFSFVMSYLCSFNHGFNSRPVSPIYDFAQSVQFTL